MWSVLIYLALVIDLPLRDEMVVLVGPQACVQGESRTWKSDKYSRFARACAITQTLRQLVLSTVLLGFTEAIIPILSLRTAEMCSGISSHW